ncbi:MAG: hypothetical protein GC185_13145 [Alphaproteobacteria bacterium]|nr:hypothetical protein [Alphaproteobacteria bacterium]
MKTRKVDFIRMDGRPNDKSSGYFEIKDPSVVALPEGGYEMYASLGTSVTQEWVIGRFRAQTPDGPWQELPHAELEGVEGGEVCAPAVVLAEKDGAPEWKMYVQTTCFSENGVIALATSRDGRHFTGAEKPAMAVADLPEGDWPVVGLYDVAISDLSVNGRERECMAFSGYRSIGCGDVYLSFRDKGAKDEAWSTPVLALKQEDVPFHNRPGAENFEWGLEGAKVVQLADDAFLMIGVCFLDRGNEERGTRQRVFLAGAAQPGGPYVPMETPIAPTAYPEGTGENGHPDTIDLGQTLGILYQERAGEGQPWHLRYTEASKDELALKIRTALAAARKQAPSRSGGTPPAP